MTCHGRGICGCGRARCASEAWWVAFRRLWRGIALAKLAAMRSEITNAEIDFAIEQEHEQETTDDRR